MRLTLEPSCQCFGGTLRRNSLPLSMLARRCWSSRWHLKSRRLMPARQQSIPQVLGQALCRCMGREG